MLGSTAALADANIVLNTIVAEELKRFADELEKAEDLTTALHDLIRRTVQEHKRIVFNGNGYSEEWEKEAEKRGLLNLRSTIDALPMMVVPDNIKVFIDHNVFSETEIVSRYEILIENYSKMMNIEALAMIDMANKDYYPAISAYAASLAENALAKKQLCNAACASETAIVSRLSALADEIFISTAKLKEDREEAAKTADPFTAARKYRDVVFADMQKLRAAVDEAEKITAQEYWPVPNYGDLIFRV